MTMIAATETVNVAREMLPYLINGDATHLSDTEIWLANKWEKSVKAFYPDTNAVFTIEEPYSEEFSRCDILKVPATTVELTINFMVP